MDQNLLVCPECDALQHQPAPNSDVSGSLACWRCGATLMNAEEMDLERMLALTVAAAIFFVIANVFPLFTLDLQGTEHKTSLVGAVQSLWSQRMDLVALLVLATTVVFPALEIALLGYVFVAFNRGSEEHAPAIPFLLRVLTIVNHWGMVEVFMLGALVSLVKLSRMASIHAGIALWSFGAVMLLLATISSRFESRQLWGRLDSWSERPA